MVGGWGEIRVEQGPQVRVEVGDEVGDEVGAEVGVETEVG